MFLPMKTNEKLFDFKNKPKYTPGMIWLLRVSVQNPDTSTIWDRSFGMYLNRRNIKKILFLMFKFSWPGFSGQAAFEICRNNNFSYAYTYVYQVLYSLIFTDQLSRSGILPAFPMERPPTQWDLYRKRVAEKVA